MESMQYLTSAMFTLLMFDLTFILAALWVALCFFIPYAVGRWLNRVVLGRTVFRRAVLTLAVVAGAGRFCTFVFIMGAAVLQIFSWEASERWYVRLFPVGATGNTVAILCAGIAGLLGGRDANGERQEMLKAEKPPGSFRWILVLPAAVGAYIAVHIVVIIGNLYLTGSFGVYFCQFVNSVCAPYAFVLAGAKTAPRHGFAAGIALAVILAVLMGGVIAVSLIEARMGVYTERHSDPLWWLVVSSVIGIAVAIAACIQLHADESRG